MRAISYAGLLALLIIGCRAKPAPDTGFIENPSLMKLEKKAAFQRTFWDENYKGEKFTELYVAPVNMHYMLTQSFWEKANEVNLSPDEIKKSADRIAEYTRNAFIKAAKEDPKKHFTVVDQPGPHTLVLEPAIVQLVPSKAVLQALGFISWIPTAVMIGGSTVDQSEDQGKGVVAIEARVRDGANGPVIAAFADREHPPTAIVDIKSLNWWAPAKKIIDYWAIAFIATANDPKGKVKKHSELELLVW